MARTWMAMICAALMLAAFRAAPADEPEGPARPVTSFITEDAGAPGTVWLLAEEGQREKRDRPKPDEKLPEKKYGFLGITPGSLPEPLADQLGLDDGRGILVLATQKDSPAARAGLQANDVLTMIDDQVLYAVEQLQKLVAARKPGSTVKVELLRRGKKDTVKVELGGTATRPWARAEGPGAWPTTPQRMWLWGTPMPGGPTPR